MRKKTKVILRFLQIIVLIIFMICNLKAQKSERGTPISFQKNQIKKISKIQTVKMPSFSVTDMLKEDSINTKTDKPFRFAKGFMVNYSIRNSGTWDTLYYGDKLWRLVLKSPGAFSINIIFSEYHIPDGAKVFIYSKDSSNIIGAFTSKNNSESNILATLPVKGDEIIIEYFEPKDVAYLGHLTVGKISHDYIGMGCFDPPSGGSCKGLSASCERDINCAEGSNLQNEKQAVSRIFINGDELCTGSLLNNTAQDGTPYFLTANHCVCNNDLANTVVAVFNYESPTCGGVDGSIGQSVSGATLLSHDARSDFSLLRLSAPPDYAYYLGWDASGNNPPVPATCIHHPKGDVKKISVTYNSLSNRTMNAWTGEGCDPIVDKNTWKVSHWAVGLTEPGSSGSPLLDNNHRVVGQLYAAWSGISCATPDSSFFGRLSIAWINQAIYYYLDPLGISVGKVFNGISYIQTFPINCHVTKVQNQTISSNRSYSDCGISVTNVTVQNNSSLTLTGTNKVLIQGPFTVQLGSTLTIY